MASQAGKITLQQYAMELKYQRTQLYQLTRIDTLILKDFVDFVSTAKKQILGFSGLISKLTSG